MIYCAIHFCHIPYQLTTRSDHSDHSGHAFRPLLFPRTLNVHLSVHISFCSCTPIRRPGPHPTPSYCLLVTFIFPFIVVPPFPSSPGLIHPRTFVIVLSPVSLLSPSVLLLPTPGI